MNVDSASTPWRPRGLKPAARYTVTEVAPRLRRRDRLRHGFSIVEMICVVVIVGIFAAVAVPRLSNSVAIQRVEAAARRIVVDLTLARRHARVTTTSQTVSFDAVTNSYQLVGMADPDRPASAYKVSLLNEPYGANLVTANFGGDADIVFDGWGAPDSGGSIVVEVGIHQRTINVDPDTGQASIP